MKKLLLVLVLIGLLVGVPACDAIDTDLLPAADATYDVGSLALQWQNGYFSDGLFINGIPVGAGGGGDVFGPAGATNHAIARYDGVTGLLLQDSSGVTIDDFDNLVVDGDIDTGGDINSGNDVNVTNDLDVTDNADIGGTLAVTDELTVGGYTLLGVGVPLLATPDGSIYAFSNVVSETALMGAATAWRGGLWIGEDTIIVAEHTSNLDFDLTGGAFENLVTADDAVFLQADADESNFILLASGMHAGGAAEIILFIDTTHVVVETFGWDADLTNVDFVITPHPILIVGSGNKVSIDADGAGGVEIDSYGYIGRTLFVIELNALVDETGALRIKANANGYSGIEGIEIEYSTGDLQPGDHTSVLKIDLDDTGATSSDATTEIDFINILTTDEHDVEKHAIHVGQSFDSAFQVSSGVESDLDYGYTVIPAGVTDRVNGVPDAGTAFLESSAGNVEMFSSDNDYILIGSDATFEAVDAILATPANSSIFATTPQFYYSTGVGTWTLIDVSETTNGFQQSGTITFTAPGDWVKTNVTVPAGAVITDAYYIKIIRTRNFLGLPPIEDYFKTYDASSATDFEIRGDGTIRPVERLDGSAPNNSFYYSLTSGVLSYKDGSGNVHPLYTGGEEALPSEGTAIVYYELDGSASTTAAGEGGSDGAWVDWDLSAIIPAGSTTVEIAIKKLTATDDVGVRENGSALVREFNVLKLSYFTLTVKTSGSWIIEIMSDDVSDGDVFSVIGYWN